MEHPLVPSLEPAEETITEEFAIRWSRCLNLCCDAASKSSGVAENNLKAATPTAGTFAPASLLELTPSRTESKTGLPRASA